MALRVLMIRKKIDDKKKELEAIRKLLTEFVTREADLEKSIEEAQTEEEQKVVEEAVDKFEEEKKEAEEKEKTLSDEVDALEKELAEKEKPEEEEKAEEPVKEERKEIKTSMNKRDFYSVIDAQERAKMFADDSVKSWLNEIRTSIKNKRAVENVGLTIPEVVLPLLRANIQNWSKLYDKVNVQNVSGEAREVVMGTVGEAVWTECCANLNELALGFNSWDVDCYKVGGFYALCKANVEDSDYDLMAEVLIALGQAIGKALDKAILYGRNTSANQKMPMGIVTRLAQTTAPAGYPTTARAWQNLSVTNRIKITLTGEPNEALAQLLIASSAVANDYARGNITWVMNDKTYKTLLAYTLNVNSAGAVVSAINGTMPVVGGDVEVLNFIPDDVVIFGYFDLYLLAERAGRDFASSEHVRFIQDQIVYKGTARYDGAPIIAEAFAIADLSGEEGTSAFDPTAVSFPQDTANA